MPYSDKRKQAQAETNWRKENMRQFVLRVVKGRDDDIIEYMLAKRRDPNQGINETLKRLVREEIKRTRAEK